MENSIYLGLSKQMVLRTNMDIVSNNVANMSTAGFRGQNPLFEEYVFDTRGNDDELSFVYDRGQYQMTDAGPVQPTGNDLNVALIGDGFMGVIMPDGRTGYTRDGTFNKTADGTLVSSSGFPIMGAGGPITIPENSTELIIDEKGTISNQDGPIGALNIVEFDNVQTLDPYGNNLYITEEAPKPAINTTVKQGFLEGSNVNPITEMSRMIEILRQYQSTSRLLENEHERLRSAIQKLTDV